MRAALSLLSLIGLRGIACFGEDYVPIWISAPSILACLQDASLVLGIAWLSARGG